MSLWWTVSCRRCEGKIAVTVVVNLFEFFFRSCRGSDEIRWPLLRAMKFPNTSDQLVIMLPSLLPIRKSFSCFWGCWKWLKKCWNVVRAWCWCSWWNVLIDAGIREGFPHCYPHTLMMGYENNWTTSQRNAAGLVFSFGHALALAKQLYGVNYPLSDRYFFSF